MSLRARLALLAVLLSVSTGAGLARSVQPSSPNPEHTFSDQRQAIRIQSPITSRSSQGDLVRIELRTEDIAHSLTIDAYRIAKRVEAGQPVVLEFRAEQAGTFRLLLQPASRRWLPPDARGAHRQAAPTDPVRPQLAFVTGWLRSVPRNRSFRTYAFQADTALAHDRPRRSCSESFRRGEQVMALRRIVCAICLLLWTVAAGAQVPTGTLVGTRDVVRRPIPPWRDGDRDLTQSSGPAGGRHQRERRLRRAAAASR